MKISIFLILIGFSYMMQPLKQIKCAKQGCTNRSVGVDQRFPLALVQVCKLIIQFNHSPSAMVHESLVPRQFSMQSTRRVFRLKIYISLTNWIATLCMRLVISDNRYGGHAKWVFQYFKHFKCLWAFFPGLKSFKSSLTGISGKCFIMESRNKGTAGVFMHEAHWWSCR